MCIKTIWTTTMVNASNVEIIDETKSKKRFNRFNLTVATKICFLHWWKRDCFNQQSLRKLNSMTWHESALSRRGRGCWSKRHCSAHDWFVFRRRRPREFRGMTFWPFVSIFPGNAVASLLSLLHDDNKWGKWNIQRRTASYHITKLRKKHRGNSGVSFSVFSIHVTMVDPINWIGSIACGKTWFHLFLG